VENKKGDKKEEMGKQGEQDMEMRFVGCWFIVLIRATEEVSCCARILTLFLSYPLFYRRWLAALPGKDQAVKTQQSSQLCQHGFSM
jgi:hypothetical protein